MFISCRVLCFNSPYNNTHVICLTCDKIAYHHQSNVPPQLVVYPVMTAVAVRKEDRGQSNHFSELTALLSQRCRLQVCNLLHFDQFETCWDHRMINPQLGTPFTSQTFNTSCSNDFTARAMRHMLYQQKQQLKRASFQYKEVCFFCQHLK